MPAEAALGAIRDLLRERYLVPDVVPAIVARLDAGERAGRYDGDDPAVVAELIGADLRDASGDLHLGLRPGSGPDPAEARRQTVRIHHGLVEQRILDGNVRYLRITDFDWLPGETDVAYDAAARFLRDADAIVLDLRGNLGGEPAAVRYLVSHFLPPDVPVLTVSGQTTRSVAELPGGRLTGLPLYVLIDGGTYSAGEAFAYHVLHFGLGDLVGATTAGAAHFTEPIPVPGGFVLTLPQGQPVHPVTGTSWEGTGVPPTLSCAPATALEVAHAEALRRLDTDEHAWALVAAEARLQPPPSRADPAVAGRYDPVEVVLRDGEPWLVRPGRRDFRLVPLTADGLHAADGNDRLRASFPAGRLLLHFRGVARPQEYLRGE